MCGGLRSEPSTTSFELPLEVRDGINKIVQDLSLTGGRVDKFLEELTRMVKHADGREEPQFPVSRIKKGLEAWNKNNYGNRGKNEWYFIGILRRLGEEAAAEQRNLDGLPPLA